MAGTHILMVDDDEKLCRLVREYLGTFGYTVSVAHNGLAGLDAAGAHDFDAILLDVMMPGLDGFEVLKRLRLRSNVPVLMLTGLGDEADRIIGLETGADDYLPKTFSTRELLARLRAVLRRSHRQAPAAPSAAVTVGDVSADPSTRTALHAGQMLILTPVEFDILLALLHAAGRIKTREQLLLEVADRDFEVFDRSIDVHISSLRRKLGDDPKSPRYIQTVRSAGYMLLKPGSPGPA
ncbi:MAG: response regulator transcription factor [Bryobacteraceae bacterium]|nr:response regulator transcription factor [Bryobacteraceae bacterium]